MSARKAMMTGYPVQMEIWQPIAGAPRDGTKVVLLYADGRKIGARFLFGKWRRNLIFMVPNGIIRNFRFAH